VIADVLHYQNILFVIKSFIEKNWYLCSI